MRLTQCLFKQKINFYFNKHWRAQGKKKPINLNSDKLLKQQGVEIHDANELISMKKPLNYVEVVGMKPKPLKFDHTHPDYHTTPLLTFKDNNVLLEGLAQAKLITNTVELQKGLPESIKLSDISKPVRSKIKEIILSSNVFDAEQVKLDKIKDPNRPAFNFPRVLGISQERVNLLTISRLLSLIEANSESDLVRNRYIFNDLHFKFPFEYKNDLIQFELSSEFMLTGTKPLKPITMESTSSILLPELDPIKPTITLNEENIYKIQNLYSIGKAVEKRHPHTIIINFNKNKVKNLFEEEVTEDQIFGRSLLKTFTVAAAYARQSFGEDVGKIPRPFSIQCVHSDGKWFHFGVLQLNTLDFNGTDKNIWYQTERINFFDKCCYEQGKPILEGYNSEVYKILYSMYNN